MEIGKEPYFMKNKDWYYYDEDEGILKLTDKAPLVAVKSYEEYYANFKKLLIYPDLT